MGRFIDIKDQRFGRLVAIKHLGKNKNNKALWLCQCDCGNIITTQGSSLLQGRTTSCGCISREKTIKRNTKHNMRHTRIYNTWLNMKSRCYNPNNKSYKYYGGKGITICDEWLNSPQNFISWAYSNGYTDELTIDRIDVNGNYEPSNCRWITFTDQMNNRSVCTYFTIDGETHSLTEWCRIYNVSPKLVRPRINKGWDLLTAMAIPPLNQKGLPKIDF